MKFHNITTDDMLNGDGLRTVLWVSGCSHHCKGCQNPITWDPHVGVEFDEKAKEELFEKLEPDYISGLTLSGGDPLFEYNLQEIQKLIIEVRNKFPEKTIWLYTGYEIVDLYKNRNRSAIDALRWDIVTRLDVLCEGKFVEELKDVNYPWVGSTNQMVVDIPKTMRNALIGDGIIYAYESDPKCDFDQTIYDLDIYDPEGKLNENPIYVVKTDAHGNEIGYIRKYDNFAKAITDVTND